MPKASSLNASLFTILHEILAADEAMEGEESQCD